MTAVEARYERRRNGAGAVALRGDLRDARLLFNPAGWEKPPGEPGAAEAVLRLQGDALLSADAMRLDAADLSLRNGRAQFSAGGKRLEQVEIAEARFGASRFAGTVQRPLADGTPEGDAWRATLRGPLLDLRPFLSSGPAPGKRGAAAAEPDTENRSLPITLDGRFDRVLAGETGEFAGVGGGAWFDAARHAARRPRQRPHRRNAEQRRRRVRPLALARRRAAARAARLGGGWRRLPARHRREDDQRRAAHGERRL